MRSNGENRSEHEQAGSAEGRRILVVGGTSGIGGAAAMQLAAAGAHLSIVGRNRARGEAALERLRAAGGGEHRFLQADMADMHAADELGQQVASEMGKLDALVLAAGVITWDRQTGPEGVELMFGTQVLSRILVTDRLLPRLEASGGRVVLVSAVVAPFVRYQPDVIRGDRLRSLAHLNFLQLANHLWASTLHERYPGLRTTAHLVHPGIVETTIYSELPGWFYAAMRLAVTPFRVPVEVAAQNVARLAQGDPAPHGALHWNPRRFEKQWRARSDSKSARRLWQMCQETLSEIGLELSRRPALQPD